MPAHWYCRRPGPSSNHKMKIVQGEPGDDYTWCIGCGGHVALLPDDRVEHVTWDRWPVCPDCSTQPWVHREDE